MNKKTEESKPIGETANENKDNATVQTSTENTVKKKLINPSIDTGDYVIVAESEGKRRIFMVKGGTVQIVAASALKGTFELK